MRLCAKSLRRLLLLLYVVVCLAALTWPGYDDQAFRVPTFASFLITASMAC